MVGLHVRIGGVSLVPSASARPPPVILVLSRILVLSSSARPSVGCAASRSRDRLAASPIGRPSLSPLGRVFLSPMCIVLYRFAPFHQATDFRIARYVSSLVGLDCHAPSRGSRLFPFWHLTCVYRLFSSLFGCLAPLTVSRGSYALQALITSLEFETFCLHCFSIVSRPFSCHVCTPRIFRFLASLSRDKPASYRRM